MSDFAFLIPEVTLLVTLMGLVLSEWTHYGERRRLLTGTALAGLLAAGVQVLLVYPPEARELFQGQWRIDGLSFYFKLLAILLGIFGVVMSHGSQEIASHRRAEFLGLVVATALALSVVASATHLLLLYLGIQFLQFLAYFMAGYAKQSLASAEAAMKFFVFSLVSSLFFLFSVTILFAVGKTLNLVDLRQLLNLEALSPGMGLMLFGLMFLAISFFLGSFPMHLWVADVLEGAPTPSALMISGAVPMMGLVVVMRFFSAIQGKFAVLEAMHWSSMVGFVGVVTMIYGAWMACLQTRFRRLLAFVLMARMGFLVLGLMAPGEKALTAVVVNVLADVFCVAGVYFVVSRFVDATDTDDLHEWRKSTQGAVFDKIVLLIFLGSLLGLPPLPGFVARFLLLSAVVETQGYTWVFAALVAMLVGAVAFVRVANALLSKADFEGNEKQVLKASSSWNRAWVLGLMIPGVMIATATHAVVLWARATVAPILW